MGMGDHWQLGRWGGVPVALHWTVLLAFPWLYLMLNDVLAALIGSAAYVLLLLAHEGGHALMARWRRVPVEAITLNGLHGDTAHGYPRSSGDDILIAWGGVLAQLLVLLLSLLAAPYLESAGNRLLWMVSAPVLLVCTRWNLFLMIVALLPIGPMDGRRAWAVIPWLRQRLRRRRSSGKVVRLDPARRRTLQRQSEQAAADIIQRLDKKPKP
jgi:Zn-dependent protease